MNKIFIVLVALMLATSFAMKIRDAPAAGAQGQGQPGDLLAGKTYKHDNSSVGVVAVAL